MDDERIIVLFYARSEQAISALDGKYGRAVRRVAVNILDNEQDAEECVNDAYLGAWNTIPPQRPERLGAYVCRIARNLAVKRYHANTAQKRNSFYDAALDELAESIPAREDIQSALEAKELAAAINAFLDGLGYEDAFIFLRRYWYADSVSDIAAMMGVSRRRVTVRLFHTREKLKKYLMKEGMLI